VGWAAGVERLAMSASARAEAPDADVFFAFEDASRRAEGLAVMAGLRASGRRCDTDYARRSLKGQLTQANRLHARALIIVRSDRVTLRRRGESDLDLVAGTVEEVVALL
jgi:histidyl-tRNA synthetase